MTEIRTIDTVLVANRGEIAVRVIRTLREMGIRSVAVYSDADANARHVREADTAINIGPAPARESYLVIDKVIDAAKAAGAQGIHPGYGFLSENSAFSAACAAAGIAFLGPSEHAIEVMGDKITAKNAVAAFGVPVVPGIARPGLTDEDLIAAADDIGYPVLVKPSAGGGGKGMRLVEDPANLAEALRSARREAASSFGDDTLFLERFVLRPRHIEVQVLADQHGNVVHLGERECSLQRRHQKVIEEAPSPLLDQVTRDRIGAAACNTARSVDYTGAGTVEFIVSADKPDEFFFMEMNTRLQVEHPVTEMVTGLDLVEWQVRVATGEKLAFEQGDITMTGHAIEARVYAEDPSRGFLPTGGRVVDLVEPSGAGVRVDSGLLAGTVVGSDYDPMLSKVIAHAPDRGSALRKLDRALAETAVLGVVTNIEFARFLLADPDVIAGKLDTGLLDRRVEDFVAADASDDVLIAAAAYRWLQRWPLAKDPWDVPSGWRVGTAAPTSIRLSAGTRIAHVAITGEPTDAKVEVEGAQPRTFTATLTGSALVVVVDGHRRTFVVAETDGGLWLAGDGTWHVREVAEVSVRGEDAHAGDAEITSPMPGAVIAVNVESGAAVSAGQSLVVVEAMKMEHALSSPIDGIVEVLVKSGDQVMVDQLLARVVPVPDDIAEDKTENTTPKEDA
ncbi:acetyl/propionyl/methylcrotonyl-CoA carboxylase subunit alpha [Rhodococcus sp. ARC_M6]|uniref:acetyl-CoA carboxylase biotin carboxylase subunit n=1 Tax=Rhodococcus sp. ARC_M6 TaxID=2928852 RepID=UPI001FB55A1C|nr:acetyl/propionyl/methylcrotonyl-CoA carboxylase subunit alpha [Rhodococcus sp. ARC_M6]MCJ0903991.1 acetyl/propionyl/methylcrotonyl-CoA carboxylase subunit alpha [Rhodococcus sp. ARC_M6]